MQETGKEENLVRCDVAIPIHNGLTHLRRCVESVLAHTRIPYRLLLVDDGSDAQTVEYLESVARQHPQIELLRNPENLGFVKTCNRAMAASSAEYILLLNSDTIVTPGWLEKMLKCADSDPTIAAVSPVSNFCPHMRINMLPGYNILQMAALVSALSDRTYPDVTTCEGFCLLLRRRAIEELGAFDEIFSPGYGEESDFCMRAVSRGWRTVCADDTFIYHKGRATFGHEVRQELYERNSRIFRSRWVELYKRDFEEFQRRAPIDYLRERIEQQRPPNWFLFYEPPPPIPRKPKRLPFIIYKLRRFLSLSHAKYLARSILRAPATLRRKAAVRRALPREEKLRVAFLLPTMRPYGGVLSVINIANELFLAGVDVKIVTMGAYSRLDHQLYIEPIYCRSREEIPDLFPQVDIAVATQWETVRHILRVNELQPKTKTFYFIQDYEASFLPETNQEDRERVIDTYSQIQRKVVKTEYLKEQVSRHDPVVFKIRPGMDLDAFYPRAAGTDEASRSRRVLCMARPATPWRGFETMCRVFTKVYNEYRDVDFILYGTDDLSEYESQLRFPFSNRGMLSHGDLPPLYSSCAIYCDFSRAHGFGRTGTEAMACGCACVLTRSGGVSEYAIDGGNALLCAPDDEEGLTQAILRLLQTPELRDHLSKNARDTVRSYSDEAAAGEMHTLFLQAMAGEI